MGCGAAKGAKGAAGAAGAAGDATVAHPGLRPVSPSELGDADAASVAGAAASVRATGAAAPPYDPYASDASLRSATARPEPSALTSARSAGSSGPLVHGAPGSVAVERPLDASELTEHDASLSLAANSSVAGARDPLPRAPSASPAPASPASAYAPAVVVPGSVQPLSPRSSSFAMSPASARSTASMEAALAPTAAAAAVAASPSPLPSPRAIAAPGEFLDERPDGDVAYAAASAAPQYGAVPQRMSSAELLPSRPSAASIGAARTSVELSEHDIRFKVDAQMMAVREKHELQAMLLEDQRSHVREDAEADQQRQLQYEYALRKKADEENRLLQLEEEALRKDLEDLADPSLVSFKVVFPNSEVFEVYRYHLPLASCTVLDLKLVVNMEFGYSFDQQRFFYKTRELDDAQALAKLPDWSAAGTSVLYFHPTGEPPIVPERIVRPPQREPKIDDVRTANCAPSDQIDPSPLRLRDWATELRAIEERPKETSLERLEAEKALFELHEDFADACEAAVHEVIDKHLEPVVIYDAFGNGGDKFFVAGMCLRKVANWEMLGENVGEGDAAFKVAGHELKGLDVLRSKIEGLHVPLAAIVDYFGNRFLCTSIADMSFNSLAYGSSDDALTVKRDDTAHGVAQRIADVCNLKAHSVIERLMRERVELATPYTVELHRPRSGPLSTAGVFVLHSAARLMPPDMPGNDRIEHMVKMLRPEFVLNYGFQEQVQDGWQLYTSLNPKVCDATGKIILDYEYYEYEKRNYVLSVDAYERMSPDQFKFPRSKLVKKSVPRSQRVTYWKNEHDDLRFDRPIKRTPLNPDAFVLKTDPSGQEDLKSASAQLHDVVFQRLLDDIHELRTTPSTAAQLTDDMHARGINMRYLGRLASEVQLSNVRELAVREMLSRTIKVLIRDGLSFLEEFSDAAAKEVVLHYLNEIFTPVETESSLTVWKYIEELCRKKFSYAIDENVRDKIYCLALVHSIIEKLGIVLTKYKGYDFGTDKPFALDDVDVIAPKTKRRQFSSEVCKELTVKAKQLDQKGLGRFWYTVGGPEREKATDLLRQAVKVCEYVYGRSHTSTADAYFELASQLESRHCERGRPERSRWNRCQGIDADEFSVEATDLFRRCLQVREDQLGFYHEDVAACYAALARLAKAEPAEVVVDCLSKAVDITESVMGFNDPETAEMYRQIALLYQEIGRVEDAAPYIRRAFVIFMTIFGRDSEITEHTWRLLQGIELSVDSGLQAVPIEELVPRIEALTFDDGDDDM